MKNSQIIRKGIIYIYKHLLFLNIKNKYAQTLAYNCFCYKKLEKKYKKKIENFELKEDVQKQSNKVWILWLQGIENAPYLVKNCFNTIKKYLPNKEIIILNEDSIKKYITLPDFVEKKYKKGIIPFAHYSDLIRLKILNKYGGLWLDATILMTSSPSDDFFLNKLFVYKNISLDRNDYNPIVASNWLIYSYSNNQILQLTEYLLLEYWKKNNLLLNYNIFHLFFTMATKKYPNIWNNVPTYSNVPPHVLQFELLNQYKDKEFELIKKNSIFHKLNHRIQTNDKKSFYYKLFIDNKGDKL